LDEPSQPFTLDAKGIASGLSKKFEPFLFELGH